MTTISKKERRKVYLDAAKFFSGSYERRSVGAWGLVGFCDYLELKLEDKKGGIDDYPEYAQFKSFLVPENYFLYWFNTDDHTDRIAALKLAAKLCTMSDKDVKAFFTHLHKEYQRCENIPLAFTEWNQNKK